jgi:hypothetical protein
MGWRPQGPDGNLTSGWMDAWGWGEVREAVFRSGARPRSSVGFISFHFLARRRRRRLLLLLLLRSGGGVKRERGAADRQNTHTRTQLSTAPPPTHAPHTHNMTQEAPIQQPLPPGTKHGAHAGERVLPHEDSGIQVRGRKKERKSRGGGGDWCGVVDVCACVCVWVGVCVWVDGRMDGWMDGVSGRSINPGLA